MTKRHTLATIVLATVATLTTYSCIGKQPLEAPDIRSVQIRNLQITSTTQPALEKTFFSIDHRQGLIYNAHPLPYGSEIKLVKMKIDIPDKNKVRVFVGDKEEEFGAKDSLNLSNWQKGIRLEVVNADASMKKTYRLNLKRYEYDPLTFSWQRIGTEALPDLNGARDVTLCDNAQKPWLIAYHTDKTHIYSTEKDVPLSWSTKKTIPFALTQVAIADGKTLFGLNEKGGLYTEITDAGSFSGTGHEGTYENLLEKYRFVALLGAFYEPGKKFAKACVVVEDPESKKFFFAWVEAIRDGMPAPTARNIGNEMPSTFPLRHFTTLQLVEAHHPKIMIVGEAASSTDTPMSLWSTTTGMDWLTLKATDKEKALPASKARPTLVYDNTLKRYYLYYPSAEGYVPYVSDNGADWKKGDTKLMLPQTADFTLRTRGLLGYAQDNHRIVLMGGITSSGGQLRDVWQGVPKIYEAN